MQTNYWNRILIGGKFILVLMICSMAATAQQRSLFLAAGQSNAVGKGNSGLSVRCMSHTAWEYRWKNDTMVALQDPVGEVYRHLQQAESGSCWPAFAAAWHQRTGDTVIIVPAARGGSSCHAKAELGDMDTWDTTGTLFPAAIAKTTAALKHTSATLRGIIWLQGERDANAINAGVLSAAAYQAALTALVERFRSALGGQVPFYIVQTGNYKGHPVSGFDAVRKAQQAVATKMPAVYIVYSGTPAFPGKQWMMDDIHYNQDGLNDIGTTIAKMILK